MVRRDLKRLVQIECQFLAEWVVSFSWRIVDFRPMKIAVTIIAIAIAEKRKVALTIRPAAKCRRRIDRVCGGNSVIRSSMEQPISESSETCGVLAPFPDRNDDTDDVYAYDRDIPE